MSAHSGAVGVLFTAHELNHEVLLAQAKVAEG